jgi:hypothetical protein
LALQVGDGRLDAGLHDGADALGIEYDRVAQRFPLSAVNEDPLSFVAAAPEAPLLSGGKELDAESIEGSTERIVMRGIRVSLPSGEAHDVHVGERQRRQLRTAGHGSILV